MGKLLITILCLNIVCCVPTNTDTCHYSLKLGNKTDRVLFVRPSSDTILYSYMDPRDNQYQRSIQPYAGQGTTEYGSLRFLGSGSPMCVENLFKNEKHLYVFVFDSIALGNKDWDEVRKDYLVTERYDLTLKDLENMNWTITYDGD